MRLLVATHHEEHEGNESGCRFYLPFRFGTFRFPILIFILIFFLIPSTPSAHAETVPVWTKYDNTIPADSDTNSTNGRLAIGTATKGDITYTMDPIVIMDGSTYKMWYSGYVGANYRVYYAGTTNPLVWTKYDNTIPSPSDGNSQNGRIPLGTAGKGDTNNALGACVILDGGIYKMWYAGYDSTNRIRIYYATSTNGLDWTKQNNAIPTNSNTTSSDGRIPLGTAGAGDTNYAWRCWVIKDDDGIYKMWYTGYNGVNYRIYHATSSNALDWTKYDNSIPTNSDTTSSNGRIPLGNNTRGDDAGTMRPVVVKDGATYKMWYSGSDGANWRIYYATSTNGLDWVKYDNTIPSASNGSSTNGRIPLGGASRGDTTHAYAPMVIKDGTTYRMWYEGYGGAGANYQIYYATSTNGGLTWTKQDNTVPPLSDADSTGGRVPLGKADRGDDGTVYRPVVIKDGATYKMWYSGSDGTYYRIYYATSPDGLVWTKYNTDIPPASNGSSTNGQIPLGGAGRGDDYYTYFPCVVKDGTDYKMWYTGYDNPALRIYYATSTNGLDWTKYNNIIALPNSDSACTNGTIPLGTNGADKTYVLDPWVIVDGTTYKMWYSGYSGSVSRIYYATSTNGGLNWTKYDNSAPAVSDTTSSNGRIPLGTSSRGDSSLVRFPMVLKDGGIYRMWYGGYDGLNYRLYSATSSNGLDWVKYDNSIPVDSDTATSSGRIALGVPGKGDDLHVYSGTVLKDGQTYKMWYSGNDGSTTRIYYATCYIGSRASLISSE